MNLNRIIKIGVLSFLFAFLFIQSHAQNASKNGATQIVDLNGEWSLTGYNSDYSQHISLKAIVPGQVHADLWREGLIEDPFWRENAEKCQWVEFWEWRYKKHFLLPKDFKGQHIKLQFDGLDTFTEIYLNGRRVGPLGRPATEDMFLAYEFDVTGWLKENTENVLEVKFLPIRKVVGKKAEQKAYPAAFEDPFRAYVRRMQCTFGWDWVHRFVSAGIWRSCRIVSLPDAKVEDVFFYTKALHDGKAEVHCQTEIKSEDGFEGELRLRLVDPSGKTIWKNKQAIQSGTKLIKHHFDVDSPQLWWPNGAGEHPLYQVVAEVYDSKSKLLNHKTIRTGIRTVKLVQEADQIGRSFRFEINGKPIFAKGGNWIPADPFPARITHQKYEMLLKRTADAGINMLRLWGGGIYEQEDFWELCDQLGIMVWHDFMLACGDYPQDDAFVDLFLREVEYNVKRVRNYPSLVLWCGDNELGMSVDQEGNWFFKDTQLNKTAPLVARLDPSRNFQPTSPYGPQLNCLTAGDAHQGAQYTDHLIFSKDAADYRYQTAKCARARFLSESTTAGCPTESSLLKFMSEEDLDRSEIFDYHTKDNPYIAGAWTLFGKLEHLSQLLYGDHEGIRQRRLRQMEYCQYEFVRITMEASRGNKFNSGGVLFWMMNDCWPASGWSLMDYWGTPKAGWYAMKSGSKPVIASTQVLEDKICWTISSDRMSPSKVNYKIWIQPLRGGKSEVLKSGQLLLSANSAKEVMQTSKIDDLAKKLGKDRMLVFQIEADGETDRSYWTPLTPLRVEYPRTKLSVSGQNSGVSGDLVIKSEKWGRVVTLKGDALFSDNYFELLPGEQRTIHWESLSGQAISPIQVSAWNEE